jgi:hypothetical protein
MALKTTANPAPAAASKPASQPKPQSAFQPTPPAPAAIPHDLIAARAKTIWQSKGWPADQDVQNWLEAETQLRNEASPDRP